MAVAFVVGRSAYVGWEYASLWHARPGAVPGGITAAEVAVSEITVVPHRWNPGSCVVVAKVTNRATKPLVLPVFDVSVGHPPQATQKCVSSLILAPGESGTFASASLSTPPAEAHPAYASVTLAYSDPIVESSHVERQLKYRPMLGLTAAGEFRNDSGLDIDSVRGVVIIADGAGIPLSVAPFTFEPKKTYPEGYLLGGDYRGAGSAGRRVVEIHTFHEAGTTAPESVPVAPTVR